MTHWLLTAVVWLDLQAVLGTKPLGFFGATGAGAALWAAADLRGGVAAVASRGARHELAIVPGATHLFDEPGALDQVAELASAWFARHRAPG